MRIGVKGEIALPHIGERRLLEPASTVETALRVSSRAQGPLVSPSRQGKAVGMRSLEASTTPPIACEPQRRVGRAAHHLEPADRQRIERDAMVLAELRDAAGADAILLNAHAIIVEPAHDRPAGARPAQSSSR